MNYKVDVVLGWRRDIFYYSDLEHAVGVVSCVRRDGGVGVVYERTPDGWKEMEV